MSNSPRTPLIHMSESEAPNGSIIRQRSASVRQADEEQTIGNHTDHSQTTFHEEPFIERIIQADKEALYRFWDRFNAKGRKNVGVVESLKAIALSSWLNSYLIFIPLAWVSHFLHWNDRLTFILCLLAIIPLERLFDYLGEQIALYCGKDLGDLIIITMNNNVEATLAIILLVKHELKLLQSTIVGVVILHLLLVPGTSFITGGARIISQELHPHLTQLNHTLLTIGVMTLLLPAAIFAASDGGVLPSVEEAAQNEITDATRGKFLQMSRGLAIILLLVYIASRIFLHNPPGEDKALRQLPLAPQELLHEEAHLATTDPEVNQWVCIVMLIVSIAIMAVTAEWYLWLVEGIEFVREDRHITEEWFGLILLPIVSFAADGTVAICFFIRRSIRHILGEPDIPSTLAKARAIDLSIQFTLFWMPFFVLLGWWTGRPFTLLFDLFEVAVLIGACFIVNYVTADSKTNWAEGFAMVSFYFMIALCVWFYEGQPEIAILLASPGTVAEAIVKAAAGGEGGPIEE